MNILSGNLIKRDFMKKLLFAIGALLLSVSSASAGWVGTVAQWVKIIAEIVLALFSSPNLNVKAVVHQKSIEYGVSECEVWRHGGFGHADEMPVECRPSLQIRNPRSQTPVW